MAPQDLFPIFSTDLKAKFMVLGVHGLIRHLPLPGNLCIYTSPNPEEGLEVRDFWLAIEHVCGRGVMCITLTAPTASAHTGNGPCQVLVSFLGSTQQSM